MNITVEELQDLAAHGKVVTDRGEKVGLIGEIYVDDLTGAPDWVTVKIGLFGSAATFVPLRAARIEGDDLLVPYAKDLIKDAPRMEAGGSLSPQEEQILYRHYSVGITDSDLQDSDGRVTPAGQDTAMTRSEERLVVGTQNREVGRARLRKHVVAEHVTQTVPLRHEEVRVTREQITDVDLGTGEVDLAIRAEDYEIVLHAETPVVQKVVVPVERVRLDTVDVTDHERISADVRKEQIELDDPTGPAGQPSATTPAVTTVSTENAPSAAEAGASKPKTTPQGSKKGKKGKKGSRRRR